MKPGVGKIVLNRDETKMALWILFTGGGKECEKMSNLMETWNKNHQSENVKSIASAKFFFLKKLITSQIIS
jgi:frataxin-like iron-binding protein CyaY